jgi:uncharacterized protein (TIRG00374 family)
VAGWVKKTLQYTLFLGIGVALLYLTFSNIDPVELWNSISTVHTLGLITIIGIGFLAIVFRGLRWVQMLHSLGYEVHGGRAIAAVAFSYLVNLVTPRVGEVARCTAINKTNKVPIDKLLGTVVLERVVDTFLFGIVVVFTFFLSFEELQNFLTQSGAALPPLNGATLVIALSVLLALFVAIRSTKSIWSKWAVAIKVKGFLKGMYLGLRSLKTVENKPLFWFYSVGIWSCYVATIAVGFTIVQGLESLEPSLAFFVSVAAGLGFVIPVPGGIGAYHYLVSKALVILGITPVLGTAFATIIHSSQSLMFIVVGALGFVFLYFARSKKHS